MDKYPKNVICLTNDSEYAFSSYNMALDYASGKYLNFLGSIDQFSRDVLKGANKFFKDNDDVDVVSLPIKYMDFEDRKHPLHYKFEEEGVVDLNNHPNYLQLDLNSVFIRKTAIEKDQLFFTSNEHGDILFINKILLNNTSFGLINNASYLYRENFDEEITINKEFIFNSFENFYDELINYSIEKYGFVHSFIQRVIVYYLRDIVEIPVLEDVIENEKEIDIFWEKLSKTLEFIDYNSILKHPLILVYTKKFLMFVKNDEFHVDVLKKKILLKTKEYTINTLNNHRLWFDIIELKNGYLNLSGTFTSDCSKDVLSIECTKSSKGVNEIFEAESVPYLNTKRETVKYLSIPWKFTYSFDFKIPVSKNEYPKFKFHVFYNEDDHRIYLNPILSFYEYADLSRYSFFTVAKDKIILLNPHSLNLIPFTKKSFIKYECAVIKKLLKRRPEGFLKAIFYNLIYLIFFNYMRNRRIWIFSDRVDLCGDNGEHFFRYAINQKDEIKKYFVISKESEDYKRLKKLYGSNIVNFGSFKHKFLYLFAEKLCQSQISPVTYNPFVPINQRLYAGMDTAKVYFLQHGVARYDMSSWVTKFDKNLSLILTVSDMDHKEFTSDNYAYDDDIVQTLGFPRFDNLTNENLKKQIVIMPTWRNYIKTPNQLINSEYYSRFKDLLSDERLISSAKENGYEIILKPHPLMYKFIDYFDTDSYVKVDNFTKHHDILCDSALMVTDYSSVAFDFVYLKKPVIYYQYEGGEDHHFDISTVLTDDNSMEFGPIIKDQDELINKIIYYMENDCIMEDIYKERVDKFFKYNDKNNSKRVYDWIKEN